MHKVLSNTGKKRIHMFGQDMLDNVENSPAHPTAGAEVEGNRALEIYTVAVPVLFGRL